MKVDIPLNKETKPTKKVKSTEVLASPEKKEKLAFNQMFQNIMKELLMSSLIPMYNQTRTNFKSNQYKIYNFINESI